MNNIYNQLIKKINFISGIGYEMECLVPEDFYYDIKDEYEASTDYSIQIEDGYERIELKFFYFTCDIKYFFKDMKKIWEKYKVKQNKSCGNHFHISFSDKAMYYKFLFPETQKLFVSSYVSYFGKEKYLDRLENKYSKFTFKTSTIYSITRKQLEETYKSEHRYFAINMNSFNKFKTIEFRIFPFAENVWELFEQLKFLIRFLEEINRKKITIQQGENFIII